MKCRVKKVKVSPPAEKLSYDKTPEELEAGVRGDVKRQLAQPSRYELTKPNEYQHCLGKQVEASKTRSTRASGKRDVAQLE
jgi:hypothetical protein